MKVSIAMASYNGSKYLQEQLDSFRNQTRQPDELVVCDDGSTDSTLDILERFRGEAEFAVRIFRNEKNLGFTKNFEKALSNCTGDLIFLSDQDDVWYVDKVAAAEAAFLASPAMMLAAHDARLVDENLTWFGATKRDQVISGFGSDDSIATGTLTVLRRDFLNYALPIPEGVVGHDIWLHTIARLLKVRFVLDRELQLIRRHSANTSAWVASSPKKINRLTVWRFHSRTEVAKDYTDRMLINQSCREVIERLKGSRVFPQNFLVSIFCHLESEYVALMRRNAIPKAGWMNRKGIALGMLVRGDYQYFNGLGSFLRDIVR